MATFFLKPSFVYELGYRFYPAKLASKETVLAQKLFNGNKAFQRLKLLGPNAFYFLEIVDRFEGAVDFPIFNDIPGKLRANAFDPFQFFGIGLVNIDLFGRDLFYCLG